MITKLNPTPANGNPSFLPSFCSLKPHRLHCSKWDNQRWWFLNPLYLTWEHGFLLFCTPASPPKSPSAFMLPKNVIFLEFFTLSFSENEYNKPRKLTIMGLKILMAIWRKFPANSIRDKKRKEILRFATTWNALDILWGADVRHDSSPLYLFYCHGLRWVQISLQLPEKCLLEGTKAMTIP